MFLFLSCCMLPIMLIYCANEEQGIAELGPPGVAKMFSKVTLGNLGGAQSTCKTVRMGSLKGPEDVKCPNGKKAKMVA